MDILGGDILEINVVDAGTPVHIVGHSGRGHDIVQGQAGVCSQGSVVGGGTGELPSRRGPQALGVDLLHPLDYLKEPGPSGDAPGFQRGRHGQTDGLFRAAQICHYQIGFQGVQAPLHAFHAGIKALQVDGNVGSAAHVHPPLPPDAVNTRSESPFPSRKAAGLPPESP